MDFAETEDQVMIRDMVRNFAETVAGPTCHQRDKEQKPPIEEFKQFAELGVAGMTIPEKYGGFGLSFLEFCILLAEAGRVLLPEPLFETVLLGGMPIFISGNEKQKEELLPKVISGESIITLAFYEEDDLISPLSVQTNATLNNSVYNLSGTKMFVPNANIADLLLVTARTGSNENDISFRNCRLLDLIKAK